MTRQMTDTLPCDVCGEPRDVEGWADVSTLGCAYVDYLPTRIGPCRTFRCGEVCRICRRDRGAVHGPDCGPLMFDKIERPHIITEEDCR